MTSDNQSRLQSQEIASLSAKINKSFNPKGITAKLSPEKHHLKILLEADKVPPEAITKALYKGLSQLNILQREYVVVMGRRRGETTPAWRQEFKRLQPQPQSPPPPSPEATGSVNSSPTRGDLQAPATGMEHPNEPANQSGLTHFPQKPSAQQDASAVSNGLEASMVSNGLPRTTSPRKRTATPRSSLTKRLPADALNHSQPFWRFLLFMVLTLGIYSIVWHYQQWKFVAQAQGSKFNPFLAFMASLFQGFSIYTLYSETAKVVKTKGLRFGAIFTPFLITVYYWLFLILGTAVGRTLGRQQAELILNPVGLPSFAEYYLPVIILRLIGLIPFILLVYWPAIRLTKRYQSAVPIDDSKSRQLAPDVILTWGLVILLSWLTSIFLPHSNYRRGVFLSQCLRLNKSIREAYVNANASFTSRILSGEGSTETIEALRTELDSQATSIEALQPFAPRIRGVLDDILTAREARAASPQTARTAAERLNNDARAANVEAESATAQLKEIRTDLAKVCPIGSPE